MMVLAVWWITSSNTVLCFSGTMVVWHTQVVTCPVPAGLEFSSSEPAKGLKKPLTLLVIGIGAEEVIKH